MNITDDGCAYCIKADYYKMGYANFMNHAKDGFKATGIKVTDMENEDIKPKVVGKLKYDSDFDCGARIYDTDGIAPTQQTITGGNLETKIIEGNYIEYMDNKEQTIISKPHGYFKGSENKEICPCVKSSAMAENNFVKETITDMSKKENIEQKEPTIGAIRTRSYKGQPQTLEHNGSTESNAITSVQKDNVVIEPINTTEDGLTTTLTTAHHYSGNIVNPKRGQTEMGVVEYKTTEPLNPYIDGTSRTIKGQYQCTSTANLTRGDSLGATGAITFNGREYHEGKGLSRSLKSGNMDCGVVVRKDDYQSEMDDDGLSKPINVVAIRKGDVYIPKSSGGSGYTEYVDIIVSFEDGQEDAEIRLSYYHETLNTVFAQMYDALGELPNPEEAHSMLKEVLKDLVVYSPFAELDKKYQQPKFQNYPMPLPNFRIRKLTPRECFRLMDVSEPDIDKLLNAGISNSQLYKLAGNSICCGVLYHIFRKMFIETDMDNTGKPQQLNLF